MYINKRNIITTSLVVTAILASSLADKSFHENLRFSINNRNLENVKTSTVPCTSGSGTTCVCPGGCMTKPDNNTSHCTLKRCWEWNEDQSKCQGTGPKWIPAIVLQGIPFTGAFGSGFGNMGRWDLFGIGSCIWGGGFALLCIGLFVCASKDDSKDDVGLCASCVSCYGCLFSIAVLAYWIWGIVVIANKSVDGPHGCPFAPDS